MSQLFTELSLVQQEIVSGGKNITDVITTNFDHNSEALNVNETSNEHGHTVHQELTKNRVKATVTKTFGKPVHNLLGFGVSAIHFCI
jgi:preprotein translocase subunit SecD